MAHARHHIHFYAWYDILLRYVTKRNGHIPLNYYYYIILFCHRALESRKVRGVTDAFAAFSTGIRAQHLWGNILIISSTYNAG